MAIMGFIGRLTTKKGVDLITDSEGGFKDNHAQLAATVQRSRRFRKRAEKYGGGKEQERQNSRAGLGSAVGPSNHRGVRLLITRPRDSKAPRL